MEKLPFGLLQLKILEKVEPKFMFDKLIEEFEKTKGEDQDRIHCITSKKKRDYVSLFIFIFVFVIYVLS